MTIIKIATLVAAAAFAGAFCPLCDTGDAAAQERQALRAEQGTDTSTVRLHISGMTCGTCPATARLALRKIPGVVSATVTYQDSLGVVRYDSQRVTPQEITKRLTQLTGYGARILPNETSATRVPRQVSRP